MNRVYILILAVIILPLWLGLPLNASVTTDDFLYNPSPEFMDDFFLKLGEGKYKYPETGDAALVLRRLHAFAQDVDNKDFVTAWNSLVNLPENPSYPVISDIKNEARTVNSIIPWFSDRELRSNFLAVYDEVWLKHDKIDTDFTSFKEIFSGYASTKVPKNPAAFIIDHVGYYGYSKSPGQPSDNIEFIWQLYGDYAKYAALVSGKGFDYRKDDPSEISKSMMAEVASEIDLAWRGAMEGEKKRNTEPDFAVEESITKSEPVEETPFINLGKVTEAVEEESRPPTLDYSKLNVFKLPDDAGDEWKQMSLEETDEDVFDQAQIEETEETTEEIEIEPLSPEKTNGLEPPDKVIKEKTESSKDLIKVSEQAEKEPIQKIPPSDKSSTEVKETKASESPSVKTTEIKTEEPSTEPAEEAEIISEETITEENMVETKIEEEPVESIFVTPEVKVIEPEKETQQEPVVDIPPTTKEEVKPVEEKPSETIDLLKSEEASKPEEQQEQPESVKTEKPVESEPAKTVEVKEPVKKEPEPVKEEIKTPIEEKTPEAEKPEVIKPVETKPTETKPVETIKPEVAKPSEEKLTDKDQAEVVKLANQVNTQVMKVSDELGGLIVDLVIIWETDPESIEDYDKKESDLRQKFSIKKEEFLALLFIIDAFRLEEDLGISYEAMNSKLKESLLAKVKDFLNSDRLKDYPTITEEKLLTAAGQLTSGIDTRRDTLKIQEASRKAYSRRHVQFSSIVTKLSDLKKIEISDDIAVE
jgi:hypothetical protein